MKEPMTYINLSKLNSDHQHAETSKHCNVRLLLEARFASFAQPAPCFHTPAEPLREQLPHGARFSGDKNDSM